MLDGFHKQVKYKAKNRQEVDEEDQEQLDIIYQHNPVITEYLNAEYRFQD